MLKSKREIISMPNAREKRRKDSPCSLKWKSKDGERVMKKEATPKRV
jgi:hypothetical protein